MAILPSSTYVPMGIYAITPWHVKIGRTLEPVLCDLSNEQPLVLKDRFHGHGLFLMDVCTTFYVGPSVLRDRFCSTRGVVSQDWFYCMSFRYAPHIHDNVPLSLSVVLTGEGGEKVQRFKKWFWSVLEKMTNIERQDLVSIYPTPPPRQDLVSIYPPPPRQDLVSIYPPPRQDLVSIYPPPQTGPCQYLPPPPDRTWSVFTPTPQTVPGQYFLPPPDWTWLVFTPLPPPTPHPRQDLVSIYPTPDRTWSVFTPPPPQTGPGQYLPHPTVITD